MAEMVYITELDTGTRVALPVPPESVKTKAAGKFLSYNVIKAGEVKLPNGEKLTKFSWSGILPGRTMRHMRMVSAADWKDPKEIQGIWSAWRTNGKKLRLLVTGTTINHNVYLENYTVTNKGLDRVEYSISFIVAKDIMVYTTSELNIKYKSRKPPTTKPRPAPAKTTTSSARTYTVKPGDCLWNIARKFLGNGSRYMEIYNANKSIIGSNPNLIYAGQVYTIPS